jgi:hypothetical protein
VKYAACLGRTGVWPAYWFFFFLVGLPTLASAEPTRDLPARYQIIIDRSPFGALATGPANAPSFAARFTFVGLVNSNGIESRLQAIIHDKDANRSYFKSEGETIDDIKVVKVEDKPAKVVLQKGLESATLTYQEKGNVALPQQPMAPQQPQPSAPTPGGVPGPRRIPFRRAN